jgi:hypothetical protein
MQTAWLWKWPTSLHFETSVTIYRSRDRNISEELKQRCCYTSKLLLFTIDREELGGWAMWHAWKCFMRSALFWDIPQRWVVVKYRRFGTTYRVPSLGVKKSKTSVQNYHSTLRNIPEEHISHLQRGGSLKSRGDLKYIQHLSPISPKTDTLA